MLFLDGFSIGENYPEVNPLLMARMPAFHGIFGGIMPTLEDEIVSNGEASLVLADATLGVEGLPQSGTGQTALFCGLNAAQIIGKHFGPYPHSQLKPLLQEKSLFRQLLRLGKSVYFANAYPRQFFEYVASGKTRFTVTTLTCMMLGIPLLGYDELVQGKAISADITRERWKDLGYDHLQPITPEDAGRQLCAISQQNDLTLFEYFLTDHAGHSQNMELAVEVLELFDAFLGGILEELDSEKSLLIVTSDHGNVEDLSTKTHTRNPVPVILIGPSKDEIADKIHNISHVTPALMKFVIKEGYLQ